MNITIKGVSITVKRDGEERTLRFPEERVGGLMQVLTTGMSLSDFLTAVSGGVALAVENASPPRVGTEENRVAVREQIINFDQAMRQQARERQDWSVEEKMQHIQGLVGEAKLLARYWGL